MFGNKKAEKETQEDQWMLRILAYTESGGEGSDINFYGDNRMVSVFSRFNMTEKEAMGLYDLIKKAISSDERFFEWVDETRERSFISLEQLRNKLFTIELDLKEEEE